MQPLEQVAKLSRTILGSQPGERGLNPHLNRLPPLIKVLSRDIRVYSPVVLMTRMAPSPPVAHSLTFAFLKAFSSRSTGFNARGWRRLSDSSALYSLFNSPPSADSSL